MAKKESPSDRDRRLIFEAGFKHGVHAVGLSMAVGGNPPPLYWMEKAWEEYSGLKAPRKTEEECVRYEQADPADPKTW